MKDWQCKRKLGESVDQLAHNVGALVPKKQVGQHLHLEIGTQLDLAQHPRQSPCHQRSIARQVFKRQAQVKVLHHLLNQGRHGGCSRVVGTVGRARLGLTIFDVLGANSRPHEDEIVVEMGAMQDFGGDRVEESLGQLRLVVVDQQTNVVQLDLLPDVHRLLTRFVLALQTGGRLSHPKVVKLNPLALSALLTVPVGGLKTVFGTG